MSRYTHHTKAIRKIITSSLSIVLGMTWLGTGPAFSQTKNESKMPASCLSFPHASAAGYEEDTLLLMPAADANRGEVNDAIKKVHARILNSIDGRLRVLRVRTEKGKLTETERKLGKDKHFAAIQRNYQTYPQGVPTKFRPYFNLKTASPIPVNDPNFNQEWYLGAVHAPQAWQTTFGAGVRIAIFDSGCNFIGDVAANRGFDGTLRADQDKVGVVETNGDPAAKKALNDFIDSIMPHNPGGYIDSVGHGTEVATTVAARVNNGINTAGVAPNVVIEPVRVSRPNGFGADEMAILLGLEYAKRFGIKIVNISYNAQPPLSLSNFLSHQIFHAAIKDFYDNYDGLVFVAAGDYGIEDKNQMYPYMNVVSAIDSSFGSANVPGVWASDYGNPIEFCAPGTNIACSGKNGSLVHVDGTSFASAICAGVAALVWSANPNLKNTQVKAILSASCKQLGVGTPIPGPVGATWNPYFGYGMPDAEKAVKMARGI